MNLKKLIKKIIKEQSSQAVLHQYGRCPSGTGTTILNQGQYGTLSLGYKALLQGPQEDPPPNNYGSFTLEQVLNNNNVIHSVWGSPSPGQVVKFQTCPPSNPNCESTCMQYNGTITLKNVLNKGGSSLTTTDVLDNSTLNSMGILTYPGASNLGLAVFTQFDIAPGTGQYAGFDPETNPIGYGTLGTYNSCAECEALPGEPDDDTIGVLTPNKAKVIEPIKDKMVDPQVSRMQKLANIKPLKEQEENPINAQTGEVFECDLCLNPVTISDSQYSTLYPSPTDGEYNCMIYGYCDDPNSDSYVGDACASEAYVYPLNSCEGEFMVTYENCQLDNYTNPNPTIGIGPGYTGNPQTDPTGCCFACDENGNIIAAVSSPGSINYYDNPDAPPTGTCDGIQPMMGSFPNYNAAMGVFQIGGMQHPTLLDCSDPCDNIPEGCCDKCTTNPNMLPDDPCYPYCECCDPIPLRYKCSAGGQCISSTNPDFPFATLDDCILSGCGRICDIFNSQPQQEQDLVCYACQNGGSFEAELFGTPFIITLPPTVLEACTCCPRELLPIPDMDPDKIKMIISKIEKTLKGKSKSVKNRMQQLANIKPFKDETK